MTKETIDRELEIARAKKDARYEEKLLRSYENTYGEKHPSDKGKKPASKK